MTDQIPPNGPTPTEPDSSVEMTKQIFHGLIALLVIFIVWHSLGSVAKFFATESAKPVTNGEETAEGTDLSTEVKELRKDVDGFSGRIEANEKAITDAKGNDESLKARILKLETAGQPGGQNNAVPPLQPAPAVNLQQVARTDAIQEMIDERDLHQEEVASLTQKLDTSRAKIDAAIGEKSSQSQRREDHSAIEASLKRIEETQASQGRKLNALERNLDDRIISVRQDYQKDLIKLQEKQLEREEQRLKALPCPPYIQMQGVPQNSMSPGTEFIPMQRVPHGPIQHPGPHIRSQSH